MTDGVQSTAINTFLFFYLTAVCGMPGTAAGSALALALAVDAITDPLIGYLSDRTRSRWGRRLPWMAAGLLPLAAAVALAFSVPEGLAGPALFAWVLAAMMMARVSFSAFILPYFAVGAEISTDYHERSLILTWRNAFNILGYFVVIGLGFGVFLRGENGLLDRAAYVPFAWLCAALMIGTGLTALFGTWRLRQRLHPPAAGATSLRWPAELARLARNPSFLALFGSVLVFWIGMGTAENLAVHALAYFWKLPESTLQHVVMARAAGLAVGVPVCVFLLKRLEKRVVSATSLAVIAGCYFLPPLAGVAGLLPAPDAGLPWVLGAVYLLVGTQLTCLGIAFGSMMADAADEHDLRFGVRREGLYFASLTFGGKCALGLGALLAGVALDAIGFPTDLAQQTVPTVPDSVALRLGLVYGPSAALIMLAGAAVLLRYRIDRAQLATIQGALARRNAG